jgi:hypothetical protein
MRRVTVAVIRSFGPGVQSVRVHETEVDCYYQTVLSNDGTVFLHLTTFGSDGREVPGKSSQSFQFNSDSARQLVEIIETAFGAGPK